MQTPPDGSRIACERSLSAASVQVRDDQLVTRRLDHAAHPRRVRPDLEHHATRFEAFHRPPHRRRYRRHPERLHVVFPAPFAPAIRIASRAVPSMAADFVPTDFVPSSPPNPSGISGGARRLVAACCCSPEQSLRRAQRFEIGGFQRGQAQILQNPIEAPDRDLARYGEVRCQSLYRFG